MDINFTLEPLSEEAMAQLLELAREGDNKDIFISNDKGVFQKIGKITRDEECPKEVFDAFLDKLLKVEL